MISDGNGDNKDNRIEVTELRMIFGVAEFVKFQWDFSKSFHIFPIFEISFCEIFEFLCQFPY